MELNTSKLGAVKQLKSYITGVGFVTSDSKLYLLGNFGNVTYDEPFMVHLSVFSFDINDNGAYIADSSGDLHIFSFIKENNKAERISFGEKVSHVHCGMDYTIVVTSNDRNLYGLGNNSYKQLCSQNQNTLPTFKSLELSLG